jgi:hypothetical protein
MWMNGKRARIYYKGGSVGDNGGGNEIKMTEGPNTDGMNIGKYV